MNTTYRQIPQKSYNPKDGGPPFSIIDASPQVSRDLLGIVPSPPPPGVPANWLLDYSAIDVYSALQEAILGPKDLPNKSRDLGHSSRSQSELGRNYLGIKNKTYYSSILFIF
jgi:hypothetical protein